MQRGLALLSFQTNFLPHDILKYRPAAQFDIPCFATCIPKMGDYVIYFEKLKKLYRTLEVLMAGADQMMVTL
jgi:hypothetical protein